MANVDFPQLSRSPSVTAFIAVLSLFSNTLTFLVLDELKMLPKQGHLKMRGGIGCWKKGLTHCLTVDRLE